MESMRVTLVRAVSVIWSALWILALGAIGLWGFFMVMGAVSLSDPIWMTVAAAVLAVLAAIHFAHVRRALSDHDHDDLARALHAMRERRGF